MLQQPADPGEPGESAVQSLRGAAFFDLDKTLMAGSSGIFFARAAYETGMISRSRLAKDVYENVRFRLLGSTDDRADDVRRRVGEMIAGVRVRDLERLSPRVLAGVLPRLYPEMLERAYAHQDQGMPVYILTAASQEMADLLAHVLAFDGGIGSRSEIVDGRYTGRPAGPFNYREGKVLAMREVADREGLALGAPTPTRTPSRTCRCCGRYATRWSSTPTPRCAGSPWRRAGRWWSSTASDGG